MGDDTIPERCVALAERIERTGQVMFSSGSIIGPDRVAGRTRHGFGDDRVAATGYVVQTAGDLAMSAVASMRAGRTYSAAALLRQIIECEYLVTLFGLEPESAREWLDADPAALRSFWSPAKMRERSGDRFTASEYAAHCAVGGHPTPGARLLLAGHTAATPPDNMWADLSLHLERLWSRIEDAADSLGYGRDRVAAWSASPAGV